MNAWWEKNPNYIWEDSNLYYICDSYIADYISGRDMPHIKKIASELNKSLKQRMVMNKTTTTTTTTKYFSIFLT